MEYTQDRVKRPPGMTTDCLLVEGTIQLAGHDADLNIVFPGGQKAVLQWRVDRPTLDLCFEQPVDVFSDGPDMEPAPTASRPNHHSGVVQLVIPLRPEYREKANLPYSVGLVDSFGIRHSNAIMGQFSTNEKASAFIETLPDHEDGQYYLDGPPDDIEEEAKS